MNLYDLLIDAASIVDDADAHGNMSAEVTICTAGLNIHVTRRVDGTGYWLSGSFVPVAFGEELTDDIPFT